MAQNNTDAVVQLAPIEAGERAGEPALVIDIGRRHYAYPFVERWIESGLEAGIKQVHGGVRLVVNRGARKGGWFIDRDEAIKLLELGSTATPTATTDADEHDPETKGEQS